MKKLSFYLVIGILVAIACGGNSNEIKNFNEAGISFQYPGNWRIHNKLFDEYPKTIMLTNTDLSLIDIYIYNDSTNFDFMKTVALYAALDSDSSKALKHLDHIIIKGPDSATVLTDNFISSFGNNSHPCFNKFTYKKTGAYNNMVVLHESEDTTKSLHSAYQMIIQTLLVK